MECLNFCGESITFGLEFSVRPIALTLCIRCNAIVHLLFFSAQPLLTSKFGQFLLLSSYQNNDISSTDWMRPSADSNVFVTLQFNKCQKQFSAPTGLCCNCIAIECVGWRNLINGSIFFISNKFPLYERTCARAIWINGQKFVCNNTSKAVQSNNKFIEKKIIRRLGRILRFRFLLINHNQYSTYDFIWCRMETVKIIFFSASCHCIYFSLAYWATSIRWSMIIKIKRWTFNVHGKIFVSSKRTTIVRAFGNWLWFESKWMH